MAAVGSTICGAEDAGGMVVFSSSLSLLSLALIISGMGFGCTLGAYPETVEKVFSTLVRGMKRIILLVSFHVMICHQKVA
eukprot:m.5102 g.5102  ORF g.5102 m.5102 type:complete len:80 (-) comp4817_c0_seq2:32-271(-)